MVKNKIPLWEWIEKLKAANKIIVVEGIKDKRVLERLGVRDIITINQPIYKIVEEVANQGRECIILTDFDKKGKQLYGKLKSELCKLGVKVDHYFREWLQSNTRLSHIEGLEKYLENK